MSYITAEFGKPVLPPKQEQRIIMAPFRGHENPMLALAMAEGHVGRVPPSPTRPPRQEKVCMRKLTDDRRQEAVLAYLERVKKSTTTSIAAMMSVSKDTAYRVCSRMEDDGILHATVRNGVPTIWRLA